MRANSNPFATRRRPWGTAIVCVLAVAAACLGYRFCSVTRSTATKTVSAQQTAIAAPLQPRSSTRAPLRDAPITQLAVLIFKSEKRTEVWGLRGGAWKMLRDYPVLAASGTAGPKLREGDRQVPEGVYRIVELNPNSRFHRALKLDYPNAFDATMARKDARIKLGSDICIHGKNCSTGCVALGDPAIEDLFGLVEQTGIKNVKVVIAPNDLRGHIPVKNPAVKVEWLDQFYETIGRELRPFKR